VYDPDRPDGRLDLTASAFNQLRQYTSTASCRGYCYAELAILFPSGGRNHLNFRPTFTFPATRHHRPLACTKLLGNRGTCLLMTGAS